MEPERRLCPVCFGQIPEGKVVCIYCGYHSHPMRVISERTHERVDFRRYGWAFPVVACTWSLIPVLFVVLLAMPTKGFEPTIALDLWTIIGLVTMGFQVSAGLLLCWGRRRARGLVVFHAIAMVALLAPALLSQARYWVEVMQSPQAPLYVVLGAEVLLGLAVVAMVYRASRIDRVLRNAPKPEAEQ